MNTHHTPGPWSVTSKPDHPLVVQDNFTVAICEVKYHAHPTECEANARLIAAAPELLEIVRQIAESKDYSELHMDEIGQQARAAIAKATQP